MVLNNNFRFSNRLGCIFLST